MIDNEHVNYDFIHLILILANSASHNKSINQVMLYLRGLHSLGLTSISHVYLVSDHSYMARDHALGNREH